MCGNDVPAKRPSRILRSVAQIIEAATRMSACPGAGRGTSTVRTSNAPTRSKTTARIVRGRLKARSRLDDHLERAVDPLVEGPEGVREAGQREVVRDEARRGDPPVAHQRHDLLHRVAVRAHPVEIDLLEDDLLEVHFRGLLRDA